MNEATVINETLETLRELFAAKSDIDTSKISLDTQISYLGVDSLDIYDVIFGLEKKFDIHVPDAAAETIRTVRDLIELVIRLREANTTA